MTEFPLISVVIPVKNEAELLGRCLDSLRRLDYPKEKLEIIIADGLSTDATKDIALSYGVKWVVNEKEIVVSGRNCGFKKSKGDLVAFTDADCIFHPDWLKNSIKYFNQAGVGGIGGVSLQPQDSTNFEKAVDFLFSLAGFFKTTSHLKALNGAKKVKDIAGCNAVYLREALQKVMPVDEGLLTAEDVWMNFLLKRSGYSLILAPDVMLWHYRRSSLKKFLRQVYRFAIGRMQVAKRSPALINIFHIAAGLSMPLFFLLGILFYLSGVLGLYIKLIFLTAIVLMLLSLIKTRRLSSALYLPLILVLFLCAWSGGFLRELFFPLKDVKGR